MTVHAFVDETRRGSTYYLVCVLVEPSELTKLRQHVRGLLLPGQRELHFRHESKPRRRSLIDSIVGHGGFRAHLYASDCAIDEELARQSSLASMVRDLLALKAHRLVLDSRANRNDEDDQTLRRELGSQPSQTGLTFEHVDSRLEPLIWIADAVGWCYGAGGEWKRRSVECVERRVDASPDSAKPGRRPSGRVPGSLSRPTGPRRRPF